MSKPKIILVELLKKYLVEDLSFHEFKFYQSLPKFKKSVKDLSFEIKFPGNDNNFFPGIMAYHVHFTIWSSTYRSWYKKAFELKPSSATGILQGDYTEKRRFDFDIARDKPDAIAKDILNHIYTFGFQYFSNNSSLEQIAKNSSKPFERVDLNLLLNNYQTAQKHLDEYTGQLNEQIKSYPHLEYLLPKCAMRQNYINTHNIH